MRSEARVGVVSLNGNGGDLLVQLREKAQRRGLELSADVADASAVLVLIGDGDLDEAIAMLSDGAAPRRRTIVGLRGERPLEDEDVMRLLLAGAVDVIELADPVASEGLERLRVRIARWRKLDRVVDSPHVRSALVGESRAWRAAVEQVVEASTAPSRPVLLAGETGTGKEKAARVLHDLDETRRGPFVVLDCASIVETLSGSELFGHRRGAFTGADRERQGAIAQADQGTLFLDEVGELSPSLQAEFLRVLQEGTFKPVGGDQAKQSRFRLIAATNRDLEAMVREGKFRSDLYYRIASATILLPPLRERASDVPILVRHFLSELLQTEDPPTVDPRLERALRSLEYEGNVRQLRGIVQGLAAASDGERVVSLAHLPRAILGRVSPRRSTWNDRAFAQCLVGAVAAGASLADILATTRTAVIREALAQADGSAAEAARRIQVSRRLVELRRASWRGQEGAPASEEPGEAPIAFAPPEGPAERELRGA
jgi:transcriptional regulator with PAS, ATPase and Fis domain